MTSPQPSLAERLLAELAAHPDGLSLPRLRKRLDVRMSLLMRTLAWLGEDAIGGVQGAGLVHVEEGARGAIAVLTARGRAEAGR
ncbi:MAG: hypothetical protein GX538_02080 [Gammaproteobacteria bacterium]|nr:hypothetical protein [Gammaproteobacteria bacterium]